MNLVNSAESEFTNKSEDPNDRTAAVSKIFLPSRSAQSEVRVRENQRVLIAHAKAEEPKLRRESPIFRRVPCSAVFWMRHQITAELVVLFSPCCELPRGLVGLKGPTHSRAFAVRGLENVHYSTNADAPVTEKSGSNSIARSCGHTWPPEENASQSGSRARPSQ